MILLVLCCYTDIPLKINIEYFPLAKYFSLLDIMLKPVSNTNLANNAGKSIHSSF